MMRRAAATLALALALLVAMATSAFAASPHFLFANNSIDTSTGALNTAFKEAGLGTGTTSVGITLSADATATYQCYNKAGHLQLPLRAAPVPGCGELLEHSGDGPVRQFNPRHAGPDLGHGPHQNRLTSHTANDSPSRACRATGGRVKDRPGRPLRAGLVDEPDLSQPAAAMLRSATSTAAARHHG